jgi:hypothetical protein
MLNTNVKQLLGITLKHFFDIDITLFTNACLSIITMFVVLKLYIIKAPNLVAMGWDNAKHDTLALKLEAKERWENSELRDTLLHTYRTIKHNIVEERYTPGT